MSRPSDPGRLLSGVFRRLLPGPVGAEACDELDRQHAERRARDGRVAAWLWHAGHLLHPDTWTLAVALRRKGRRPQSTSRAGISLLDVKLGVRMLFKYPGLTVLGGLSMAFAIFTGAVAFEMVSQVVRPDLPLPHGARVVALQLWNTAGTRAEDHVLYDARLWQEELRTAEHVAVFRDRQQNLITADGRVEPVTVAVMSASGFRVAGVPPLMGRALDDGDERSGAPAVVVIGHELWNGRFGADPGIVGSVVRLGEVQTTVVGVMPEGFGFPVAHQVWVPFGGETQAYEAGEGPEVAVIGRLARGASMADARVELEVLVQRTAADFPDRYRHLQPRVVPWTQAALGLPTSISTLLYSVVGLTSNLPLVFFLILVCGNVALLMFARAMSREDELVVRSALGASRRRIVTQLFAEALVLASLAAVLGLVAAQYSLDWAFRVAENEILDGQPLPFWFAPSLSLHTLVYAAVLATIAAAVAGAGPALKVTRTLSAGLKRAGHSRGGFRFGGVWTLVIATQIAVTMIFPVITLAVRGEARMELVADVPFPPEQYVTARLGMVDGTSSEQEESASDRAGAAASLLEERLGAEPGVAAVTFAGRLPMTYHEWNQIEIDGPSADPRDERGHRVGAARVALDFFDAMEGSIVAGRGFHSADLEEGARSVVVDVPFVERVLGGRNAVGVRIRYLAKDENPVEAQDPDPWYQIVGVVEELGARSGYGPGGLYHPASTESLGSGYLIARVPAGADGFGSRLRAIGAEVDPALQLRNLQTLAQATRGSRDFYALWTVILLAVSGLALLLSLGGIYAVMSYTVTQRTREIGIRVALGSSNLRVAKAIFRRPLAQVGLGLAAGSLLLFGLFVGLSDPEAVTPRLLLGLSGYSLLMTAICLTACVAPTLRALAVEPGEALRIEG